MALFKDQRSTKRYMPKKPTKWGYKLWCRAGISGFVYDFKLAGRFGTSGTPVNIQSTNTFAEIENLILCLTCELSLKNINYSLIIYLHAQSYLRN